MKHTIIIAEAGVNHNGDIEKAKMLIGVAAEAGADYVKFQTFKAHKLVSKSAVKASYQIKNDTSQDNSQYNMLNKLELSDDMHLELKAYAESKNIKFLSTGFDEESLDYLDSLNIDIFKVPSGEVTNLPYLRHMAAKKKDVIMSTGMATLTEIEEAIHVFLNSGMSKEKLTVLHCNTEYPTPFNDVNLLAMHTIAKKLGVSIGYSDHTLGIEVPIAAVALGATVIEKHFTLDRNLPGPDHKASLEPDELKAMVSAIRNIELAISGSGFKEPSSSELKNISIARKSIHLKNDIKKDQIITLAHLEMLRPGDGISPMEIDSIIGKKVIRDIEAGTKLNKNDVY